MSTMLDQPSATLPREQPIAMSYAEFQQLDVSHAEWVDGKVTIFMPPSLYHQELLLFLAQLLNQFVRQFALGKVIIAPFEMGGIPGRSYREPDLLFVASANLDRLTPQRLEGPADLVVEIISPSSGQRDRTEKFDEYEAIGVREYWLIDPQRQRASFYALGNDDRYHEILLTDGWLVSTVVRGFALREAWLWQEPLPAMLPTLQIIIGRNES